MARKPQQAGGKGKGSKPERGARVPKPERGPKDAARAERSKSSAQRGDHKPERKGRGPKRGNELQAGMDQTILEGRHAFEEAMETETPLEAVYATDTILFETRMAELIAQARKRGAQVQAVDTETLDEYSSHGAHQGIIARTKPYKYASLQQLIERAKGQENALIIALDHVTDAGNFGAIVRTAEVVGATGVLIPNKRNARVNTAAYKTSAGAVLHCPIAMEANLVRSLEQLKAEGFWVAGASEHATDVLWDAPMSGRLVLVMGSEGEGLSRLTLEACDLLLSLPQAGKVESLNVAQATTALAYEWMRQCRANTIS